MANRLSAFRGSAEADLEFRAYRLVLGGRNGVAHAIGNEDCSRSLVTQPQPLIEGAFKDVMITIETVNNLHKIPKGILMSLLEVERIAAVIEWKL